MKRLVLPALAVALLAGAAAAPPASAASDSTFQGFCDYDLVRQRDVDDHVWTGEVDARTLVYSKGTPSDNPVSANVTCRILVNGVDRFSRTWSGTTLVAGAAAVTIDAGPYDWIELCTDIDYTSNDTPDVVCAQPGGDPDYWLLVQQVIDHANALLPWDDVDAAVCPLLAAQAPGVPGVVDVDPTGDTYAAGSLLYDCPPYQPV
jgi:hypothetical protein